MLTLFESKTGSESKTDADTTDSRYWDIVGNLGSSSLMAEHVQNKSDKSVVGQIAEEQASAKRTFYISETLGGGMVFGAPPSEDLQVEILVPYTALAGRMRGLGRMPNRTDNAEYIPIRGAQMQRS